MELRFEWDEDKARLNLKKHGVRFEEAKTAFFDPFELTMHDLRFTFEDRFSLTGLSVEGRVLVVAFTHREDRIRLISARKAVPRERREYERRRGK